MKYNYPILLSALGVVKFKTLIVYCVLQILMMWCFRRKVLESNYEMEQKNLETVGYTYNYIVAIFQQNFGTRNIWCIHLVVL